MPLHINPNLSKEEQIESLRQQHAALMSTPLINVALDKIITCYQPLVEIKERVKLLAPTNLSVLILGETGTGKELIAEALHIGSGRKGNFVPVNCAGIPDTLLEAEFFGSVKGAYTGSVGDREGYVSEARDGTLFLDEIGDMPPLLQSKLLRLLGPCKTFRKVGSNKLETTNFRLVAATNKNLLATNSFRPDLYYRIAGTTLILPSLGERGFTDCILIIHKFAKNQRVIDTIAAKLNIGTEGYNLQGNIRELLNIIEEQNILCK